MLKFAWLIPVIPLLSFVTIVFFGHKLKNNAAYVAIAAICASMLLSFGIGFQWFTGGFEKPFSVLVPWIPVGTDMIKVGFSIDSLTMMMLFVVTIVSTMVHIFSVGYMHGDERYPRFFSYLSLFTAAMLSLVISNTLIMMYMSWELVGLTSYLLIGFWFQKPEAMRAAKKAFLVTRVGDVGFFLGLLVLYLNTGSLELARIFEKVGDLAKQPVHIHNLGVIAAIILGIVAYGFAGAILKGSKRVPISTIVGVLIFGAVFALVKFKFNDPSITMSLSAVAALLLFWGAVGKSAQFPLHVWLPDAMEGPTPVSALIHAATMVAAGVYLVGRMYPVFSAPSTFHVDVTALTVVACIGAFTAIFAATIGIVMNDIKKVLAYSTISQLGYMMMALGVGGYTAGLFHLMTHAFFKANLFLGSGSVIHGTGTQDMRQMGGLRKKMPYTFWTFMIGTAALAGLPGFAGFFSKDEILLSAYHWAGGKIIFYVGLLGAFMTAFYMTRLVVMTFAGKPRDESIHAHESGKNMTVPLMILAALSIGAGYLGIPNEIRLFGHTFEHLNLFGRFIEFGPEHAFSPLVAGIGTLAAVLGIGLAAIIWWKPVLSFSSFKPVLGWVQTLVENKYYMDEMYNTVVIRPLMMINDAMYAFDRWVIDYVIVNGTGWITMQLAAIWGLFDRYVVDGLVNLFGVVTKLGGRTLRYVQTGIVQQYAVMLVICLILLSWYFVFLR